LGGIRLGRVIIGRGSFDVLIVGIRAILEGGLEGIDGFRLGIYVWLDFRR